MTIVNKLGVSFNVNENKVANNPGFWNLVSTDMWEPNTFKVFKHFLNEENCMVDVGAWIGPTTLFGCKLSKYVYAIEPDRVANQIINENLLLNPDIQNVNIFNNAISSYDGVTLMGNEHAEGNSMSSILFSNKNTWECKCFTLETFFKNNDIKNCNFLKMDIEGGEALVLPNSVDFLKSFDHVLYISFHIPYFKKQTEDLTNIINALGEIYTYFYLENGDEWTLEMIGNQTSFFSIVASKTELKTKW